MLFLAWAVLILIGLLFPKSRIVTAFLLLFSIVTICFRTQGADYIIYQNEYINSVYQSFSDVHYVGFLIIEKIAHSANLTFEQFTIIVGILSTALMYSGIKKLTTNVNVVLALSMIYPFSHEVVQVRTHLANSIIIFALPLLLKKTFNKKDNKGIRIIKFYLLAILACTFHFEVAFYVVCITLMLFLPEKYSKFFIFGGSIALLILIKTGILPALITKFNSRIAFWLSGKTGLGIVIPIFITLVIWFGMQIAGQLCLKKSDNSDEHIMYKRILRISDYIIFTLPLYCYDITFNRLWRVFLVLFFVMISKIITVRLNRNQRLWLFCVITVLFISVCVYENAFPILFEVFENNAIFKRLSVF